jgi:hypothetical protein
MNCLISCDFELALLRHYSASNGSYVPSFGGNVMQLFSKANRAMNLS